MILYLDMDGVLVDFNAKIVEMLGHTSESREEIGKCLRQEGFFRDLAILPGAMEAVTKLMELLPGKVRVLSAVPRSAPEIADTVRADKKYWLGQYFPALASSAEIVTDKGTVGTADDILLDDNPTWNGADNFPGLVIEFKGPSDWAEVIAEVKRRLENKSSMIKVSRILRGK